MNETITLSKEEKKHNYNMKYYSLNKDFVNELNLKNQRDNRERNLSNVNKCRKRLCKCNVCNQTMLIGNFYYHEKKLNHDKKYTLV